MAELKRLEAKRNIHISRITEVYRLGHQAKNDDKFIDPFRARYEDLKDTYENFGETHNDIIMLIVEDADFAAQDKVRKETDQFYYEAVSIFNKICKPNISEAPAANLTSSQTAEGVAKLPLISIPTFKGDQKLWPTFFDLYKRLIHENSSLSNGVKLQYLFSYLDEEPLRLLSGIAVTDDNYLIAYDKLVGRYQNKRLLASNALNSIMLFVLKSDGARELRALLNTFHESLAALNALNFQTNQWDFILFHILLEKLDVSTRTNFEVQFSSVEIPHFQDLYKFLENKCKALESVQHLNQNKTNKSSFNNSSKNATFSKNSFNSNKASPFLLCNSVPTNPTKYTSSNIKCYLCKDTHVLSKCPKYLEKTASDRCAYARNNKLCLNCLHHSHSVQNCPSSYRCHICHNKHHSILHVSKNETQNSNFSNNTYSIREPPNDSSLLTTSNDFQSTTALNTYYKENTTLLATAIVEMCDGNGNFQPVRILIDSGSTSNFLCEKCLRRLSLPRRNFSTTIYGLNQMSSYTSKGISQCVIRPRKLKELTFSFEAIVVPGLCSNMPSFNLQKGDWKHLQDLTLADEKYFLSKPVDMIIGADLFTQILQDGRIMGEGGQPTAINTVFGWVVMGKVTTANCPVRINTTYFTQPELPLEIILPKFWDLEQVPSKPFSSPEDIKCEEIFKNTVSRDSSGRFIVALPFKNSVPNLGDTFPQALRRFSTLEARLLKNPTLYSAYSDFMREYESSGHMSLVPPENPKPTLECYLAHHCVLKPESLSTKLRVVWDGSAKGPKGLSLNDTLLSGPKLQKNIVSLLLTFRLHSVVFIADIKQMFRQVLITPAHRRFQKILWRFSPEEPISEWTLNTVTFGLTCSPFLAMRTLQELADIYKSRFPQASKLLQEQVYIDDILGSSTSVSSALKLQKELIDLLKLGGFELRKWASNSPELLSAVPNSDCQMSLSFDKEEPYFLKVLGLQWQPYSDNFSYHCRDSNRPCTKRTILSDIGRIFDPLGFLCPILLLAKYLMQCLWASNISWDEYPPRNIVDSWSQIKSELSELSKLKLSRRILLDNYSRCELHGFCDASSIAYSAVIYFRVQAEDKISTFLICAKSRVAPLKTVTLPKLELLGAKLLADLIQFVKETYAGHILFDEVSAWCDSQVVLSWLNSSPSRWKPFVSNRVSHIQDIAASSLWKYIPSSLNAADCASRGMTPSKLLDHKMWWKGPPFLSLPKSEWHISDCSIPEEDYVEVLKEEKRISLNTTIAETHPLDLLLHRFSSLLKIQRVLTYCFRFSNNLKPRSIAQRGNITDSELHISLMYLIKHVQISEFSGLISKINKNQLLPKPFRKLSLFLDSEGFLRAGGRLRKSHLSYDVKHPLLLPSSHRLTTLIIEFTHKKYLHPGLKTLHNLLLQQFWILSSRKAIQKTLSNCLRCFKVRPKFYAPPEMGDLPVQRISQLKPFSHVAIDFCGPFLLSIVRMRGAKLFKSYVCVFVCTATKAVHLELTQELSTDSFVAAFRRFVARRGSVVACYTDNGTNFVGANNFFLELAKQASEKLSLKWTWSPASGPHFNGLAEAGVKAFKAHLFRVVGEQRLSFEEFTTLLCQIESVLNSRPLCQQSSDPNDLIPLTPGHFLTQEPLNSVIPEVDLSSVNINRLSRWQLIQKLHSDFWKRYHTEYLNTLQQRLKWSTPVDEIKLNDLVLIKNDNSPPLRWPLGRVINLHPGEDGHKRVVTVKTANGQLRRPVVKLCPLPKA